MPDFITTRPAAPAPTGLPIAAMLCTTLIAGLRRQLTDDLNRDRALCQRLDRAGEPADHVRRRIAATRASLAEMEGV